MYNTQGPTKAMRTNVEWGLVLVPLFIAWKLCFWCRHFTCVQFLLLSILITWNNQLNMLKCMENRQKSLYFPSREFPAKKCGASTKPIFIPPQATGNWRVPRLHKCDQTRPDWADRLNARNFWDLNVVRSDRIRIRMHFFRLSSKRPYSHTHVIMKFSKIISFRFYYPSTQSLSSSATSPLPKLNSIITEQSKKYKK
jgi:hypothetical protein